MNFQNIFNQISKRLYTNKIYLLVILLCIIGIGIIFIKTTKKNKINKQSTYKEGFTWSQDTVNEFLLFEQTNNPQMIFDPSILQKQASQEEVDHLLKNGYWPWSKEVQDLYLNSVTNNQIIRTTPEESMKYAQTVYNQTAILQLMSLQTKEGIFLINGVSLDVSNNDHLSEYAYNSGLVSKHNSIIRCNTDDPNNAVLEQIMYTGTEPITNAHLKSKTKLDYMDLENKVSNFSFVNSPCNPCVALNSTPDYSCPFKIQTKEDQTAEVSPVWKYLWSLNNE